MERDRKPAASGPHLQNEQTSNGLLLKKWSLGRKVGAVMVLAVEQSGSKASKYRQQAEELRSAANATDDQLTRETLLKFAEEYDRMALHPVENPAKKFIRFRRMKPQVSH
jgi:hypothetical protein